MIVILLLSVQISNMYVSFRIMIFTCAINGFKIFFLLAQTDNIQEASSSRVFCEKRLSTAGADPVASTVTYVFAGMLALAAFLFKP